MTKTQINKSVELPYGWDIASDYDGKIYYIDHVNKKTTWIDPRDRFVDIFDGFYGLLKLSLSPLSRLFEYRRTFRQFFSIF